MKTCSGCGLSKPLTSFSNHKGFKDGRNSKCKDCKSEQAREHYKANKDAILARQKELGSNRASELRRKFKLTLEDYEALLESQGGVCKICGDLPSEKNLSVDHDHACCPGKFTCGQCIRGLLCNDCNVAIGLMKDSPGRLRAAAEYLSPDC